MLKQLTFRGIIQLTGKRDLKSPLYVNKNIQLENKCGELLKNDEIRFVDMINPMGITMPINNHVLLISAKSTAIGEHLITKANVLRFSNLRLE